MPFASPRSTSRRCGSPAPEYDDEIAFSAEVVGLKTPASEFNVLDRIWNARVTSHIPLKDVAARLSSERIHRALKLTDSCMRNAGFARPRIAVAGLNPHAGDGGNFGREEIDVIAPVVAAGQRDGIAVEGPFPADTVFLRAKGGAFDAVLTMYHDQGQIAMKLMGFDRGVTLLGGFPFPICTPAHGTLPTTSQARALRRSAPAAPPCCSRRRWPRRALPDCTR
ncbi:4-hydroxy-L-threonine phosphate dehydrogenase PdxA [Bradyrhizobium sp. LB1.3]